MMRYWKLKRDNCKHEFVSCLSDAAEEVLPNPGRGWYSIFTFRIEETPALESLLGCINADERLALLLIDIGKCRKMDFTREMLEHVRRILAFFAVHGREMIVRPVYDTEGKGMEKEPSFLDQIQRHMWQLGPVFREFSGSICTLQGLFVGSWGEMHNSRHLSAQKLRTLAETLWKATEGSCYLAVRTPCQKRLLEDSCVPRERVGLFDDGLFGSDTHLGTFGTQEDTSIRGEPWQPSLELDYLNQSVRRTPNGGEAVWGGKFDGAQIVSTLEKMHISYLNRAYDCRILEHWKQTPYKEGKTLYEYIGLRLGYRFVLNRVWVENHSLCIEGKNEGFGNLCKTAGVRLMAVLLPEEERDSLKKTAEELSWAQTFKDSWISEKKEWKTAEMELQEDPGQWECGRTFCFRGTLPGERAGKKEAYGLLLLYLELRQSDGAFIQFANRSAGNRLFLGYLSQWTIDR